MAHIVAGPVGFWRLARVSSITLGLIASAMLSPALGQDFLSTLPSTRYLILSSPWRPTSHDECNALAQEFSAEISKLNAQHEACLQGAPSDDSNTGGSCSKASCQAVHSARDSASRKSTEETSICRKKVGEYLAEQRQEEEKRRKAAEAADREARQREREEAERKAQREAARQKDERERRDRERTESQARDERERRDREARDRSERDRQNQDREAARAKAEQESAERARREAQAADARARREIEMAQLQARAEQAKRERETKEQNLYLDLLVQLKEGKDKAVATREFMANPFEKTQELVADAVANTLVDKGLDVAATIGPERKDSRYEATAAATDEARTKMLGNNPFAEKISGVAMEGVHKINRQVLGQIDELGKQIDSVGKADAGATTRPPSTYVPPARPTGAPGGSQTPRENPFKRATGSDQVALAAPGPTPRPGPPANRGAAVTYDDPQSGRSYTIPSGRSLYRDPGTGEMSVVDDSGIRESGNDDRVLNGQLQCSKSGKGRVIPECEKRRKKQNPFAMQ